MQPKSLERLHWQCRRGMLELDLLLMPFVKNQFNALSQQEKALFTELLTYPDPDLYDWLIVKKFPSDPRFNELVNAIRNAQR